MFFRTHNVSVCTSLSCDLYFFCYSTCPSTKCLSPSVAEQGGCLSPPVFPMALALANLARRTLHPEDDSAVFLGRQFWYDDTTQKLWWDLDSVLQRLRTSCNKLQKKFEWMGVVKQRASLDVAVVPPFQHSFREGAPTNELNRCVCTTEALHTFMFVTVDQCKGDEEAKQMQAAYAGLIQRSISTIKEAADGQIIVGGRGCLSPVQHSLQIDKGGQVIGFRQIIEKQHKSTRLMLSTEWGRQHDLGMLSSSLDRATLSLVDVVIFVMTLGRQRRLRNLALSQSSQSFVEAMRRALVPWSTRMVDRWVLAKYLHDQSAAERQPAALVHERPGKRKYVGSQKVKNYSCVVFLNG